MVISREQSRYLSINGREISSRNPPFIVAELSANHNGSLQRAKDTIYAAKKAGVDAVKIQSYTPDTMTLDVKRDDFLIKHGVWEGQYLYELYQKAHTPFEWHRALFDYAKTLNITLFSSAFDESAVDLLEKLNTPAYKIASFELIDLSLIKYIACTKKPMLMSTGMASHEEIGCAIEQAKTYGCRDIILLHCISQYPAPLSDANLSAINKLKKEFNVEVGLSDHTQGCIASVVATSLGASVIEKHFILDNQEGTLDQDFSILPDEMGNLVRETQSAHASLGTGQIGCASIEKSNKIFRRSLYFVRDMKKGDIISAQDIKRIRPGFGLPPQYYDDVINSPVLCDVNKGEAVTRNHVRLQRDT